MQIDLDPQRIGLRYAVDVGLVGDSCRSLAALRPLLRRTEERVFLEHAYRTDDVGRLLYPEQVYSCPKKSGKTAFAALHVLTTTLIFGGQIYAEPTYQTPISAALI